MDIPSSRCWWSCLGAFVGHCRYWRCDRVYCCLSDQMPLRLFGVGVTRRADHLAQIMRAQAVSQVHGDHFIPSGTRSAQVYRDTFLWLLARTLPSRDGPRPLHSVLSFCVQIADRTMDHRYWHSPDASTSPNGGGPRHIFPIVTSRSRDGGCYDLITAISN